MEKSINQNVKVLGEIKAKAYDQSTLNFIQKKINKLVNWAKSEKSPRLIRDYIKKNFLSFYQFGKLKYADEHKNVICNAGFNAITKLLIGDTTYTGEINKALFGTGSGSASASDTELINETYRNDVISGTDDSNKALLTVLLTEVEYPPSGSVTITEFGNCIDGTATTDSGQLWSHLTGLSWSKDTSTAIVVSCQYTFASS